MFDNGNFRSGGLPYSRAIEYGVDETAKTIHKVWEFRHTPDIFTTAMGSVERLPNGNTLIGWGFIDLNVHLDSTALTEVKPDGTVALEMTLPKDHFSYRVYKFLPAQMNVTASGNGKSVELGQIYPNPFQQMTGIHFKSTTHVPITLKIFDALGREVRTIFDGTADAGEYSVPFDAGNFPDGVYFCKLISPSDQQMKTLLLLH